jgi:hypothetical protein
MTYVGNTFIQENEVSFENAVRKVMPVNFKRVDDDDHHHHHVCGVRLRL